MLRKELISATKNVVALIESLGLDEIRRPEKGIDPHVVFLVFRKVTLRIEQLGTVERRLLSQLDLDGLASPETWQEFLTEKASKLQGLVHRADYVTRYFPTFIQLLEPEGDSGERQVADETKATVDTVDTLCVTVIEDQERSTPARLVVMLQSIEGLYESCAEILGEKVPVHRPQEADFLGKRTVRLRT